MRMPTMTAEASLARGASYAGLGLVGSNSQGALQVVPQQLTCNSICLASWGLGCAIFCGSDTACLKQCGIDAIKACCIGAAPIIDAIF